MEQPHPDASFEVRPLSFTPVGTGEAASGVGLEASGVGGTAESGATMFRRHSSPTQI
jgi:hypothetical protein